MQMVANESYASGGYVIKPVDGYSSFSQRDVPFKTDSLSPHAFVNAEAASSDVASADGFNIFESGDRTSARPRNPLTASVADMDLSITIVSTRTCHPQRL